jgi:hypothetical protein
MAKEPKQLADFPHDTLKDIYFAGKKVLAALPKMPPLPGAPTLGVEAPCVVHDLQRLDRAPATRSSGV